MADMQTMVRTEITINQISYFLAQHQDIDDLKWRIEAAAAGGKFVTPSKHYCGAAFDGSSIGPSIGPSVRCTGATCGAEVRPDLTGTASIPRVQRSDESQRSVRMIWSWSASCMGSECVASFHVCT